MFPSLPPPPATTVLKTIAIANTLLLMGVLFILELRSHAGIQQLEKHTLILLTVFLAITLLITLMNQQTGGMP
jgi:hypothetical protein